MLSSVANIVRIIPSSLVVIGSPAGRLFTLAAVPARSTRVCRGSNGGGSCRRPHTRRGSALPRHPPASPRRGPTLSWGRCSPVVPARPQDAPLESSRSAGALFVALQHGVQSCRSSALSLPCPLCCL